MTKTIGLDLTDNSNTQPLGNGDDLHFKVSVMVTNGSNTLIDMRADTDLPFAFKKHSLIITSVEFRKLMTMLFLEPACVELHRLLTERYQMLSDQEEKQRLASTVKSELVDSTFSQNSLDFIPVTAELPERSGLSMPEPEFYEATPSELKKTRA